MNRLSILSVVFIALLLGACRELPQDATAEFSKDPIHPEVVYEELFVDVQMAGIFADSKTFVDYQPKLDPATILADYRKMKDQPDFDLTAFVEANFSPPRVFSNDFETDSTRTISEHIKALWPVLTRKPDEDIAGSLIELPHPYVVPGGRFREIYYWDSFFTMLGLQVSDEEHKALIGNMLDNFAFLIDTIGYIPNGNRTYFLGRSQPPFFAAMVNLWEEESPGALQKYLPQLEKEYAFWMEGAEGLTADKPAHRRVVRVAEGVILNRYWDDNPTPRPESYREDVELAEKTEREEEQLFRDLRAACESGWDFSSRWLKDPMDLGTIHTTDLAPVDLNCLIWNLEMTIGKAHAEAGNVERSDLFAEKANARAKAIRTYFWDDDFGMFSDYDWKVGAPTVRPSIAGMFPLYFNLADEAEGDIAGSKLLEDFASPGGVPTTLVRSSQQWDAPNGWAPLQWITVQGLENYGLDASPIVDGYIALNKKVYQNTGRMVEKYNVMDMSLEAGGGEYPLQDGFGWSNGVMLRMIHERDK